MNPIVRLSVLAFLVTLSPVFAGESSVGPVGPVGACLKLHEQSMSVKFNRSRYKYLGMKKWVGPKATMVKGECETIGTYRICWRTYLITESFTPPSMQNGKVRFISGLCKSSRAGRSTALFPLITSTTELVNWPNKAPKRRAVIQPCNLLSVFRGVPRQNKRTIKERRLKKHLVIRSRSTK